MMMASSGALEAEDGEETWRFQQAAIIEHVDMNAQKKAFDLELEGSGPYRSIDFSPSGQHGVRGQRAAEATWRALRMEQA